MTPPMAGGVIAAARRPARVAPVVREEVQEGVPGEGTPGTSCTRTTVLVHAVPETRPRLGLGLVSGMTRPRLRLGLVIL